jgi:hypothetical protein
MKIKLTLCALFASSFAALGGAVYPWVYYGQDLDGAPLTNAITIEAWPQTNTIVGVSTNLVASFSKTYYPTNPAGYYSNNLAPGNYRLTIYGQTRGVTFGIVAASTNQNLAQVAGVPAPQFMNFTLAQFSDVGSAAYSNATAFVLRSYSGVSNAVGFVLTTNSTAGITGALGYTPATNTYAGISNSVGFKLATNSTPGIISALGYTPATNGSPAFDRVLFPTNFVAANFTPVAGYTILVPSNNAIYAVTTAKTNLITSGF